MNAELKELKIKGFRSIKDQHIRFGKLNVLIGANGSGKSNLISFFKMLNFMTTRELQLYIGKTGGADSILFYSSEVTPHIESTMTFDTDSGSNIYYMSLIHATGDRLIFADEWLSFSIKGMDPITAPKTHFGYGHDEAKVTSSSARTYPQKIFRDKILKGVRYFQFHDTSETAKVKQYSYIHDNSYLKSNAGNLSAFLYMLRETQYSYYKRIILTIRQMLPFFDDFVLESSAFNQDQIMLKWKEKDSNLIFGPHQLSDGSLRMMAMVALLFQPEDMLPNLIIIDEPELGLHPYALDTIASLIRHASEYCQVIIATQSADLMDCFEPDEIIVTERHNKETIFKCLDSKELEEWREEYTMSELWKKNVLGGTP